MSHNAFIRQIIDTELGHLVDTSRSIPELIEDGKLEIVRVHDWLENHIDLGANHLCRYFEYMRMGDVIRDTLVEDREREMELNHGEDMKHWFIARDCDDISDQYTSEEQWVNAYNTDYEYPPNDFIVMVYGSDEDEDEE